MKKILYALFTMLSLECVAQSAYDNINKLPVSKLTEVFFPIFEDGMHGVKNEVFWEEYNSYYEQWLEQLGFYYGEYFMDIKGNKYPSGYAIGDHLQRLVVKESDGYYLYSTKGRVAGPFEFIDIWAGSNHVIFRKKDRYGVIDMDGNVLIAPSYDRLIETPTINMYITWSRNNCKYGIVNIENKEIQPCIYDEINFDTFEHSDIILVSKDDKWGWLDAKSGKTIVPCEYSLIHTFDYTQEFELQKGELVAVRNDKGLWGLCNRKGRLIIPCRYQKYYRLSSKLYRMNKSLKDVWGENDIVNDRGEIVVKGCHRAVAFSEKDSLFLYNKQIGETISDGVWYVAHIEDGRTEHVIQDSIIIDNLKLYNPSSRYPIVSKAIRTEHPLVDKYKYGVVDLLTGRYIVSLGDVKIWYLTLVESEQGDILILGYDEDEKQQYSFVRASDGKVLNRLSNVQKFSLYNPYHNLWYVESTDGKVGLVNSYGTYVFPLRDRLEEEIEVMAREDCPDCGFESGMIVYPNFVVASPYIQVPNDGLYDTNGRLLLQGNYEGCLTQLDGKCVMLFYKGSNNYRPKYHDFYIVEDGEAVKVENVNSFSELVYQYFVRKVKMLPADVDVKIPFGGTSRHKTYAFIIANQNYIDNEVPNALNDGNVFYEYCKKTLGLESSHVFYYANATTGSVIRCIEELKQASFANNGDINVIFYYAGHAFPDGGTNSVYLLPVDGDSRITATGYSLKKLYDELASVQAKSIVCFIDACFSGAIDGRGVVIKVKDEVPQGNIVVFTSATETETAHEYKLKKHGMFTYFLLKKLQDSKGNVTLGELADYLSENVKHTSYEENGKMQTPKVIPSPKIVAIWREISL